MSIERTVITAAWASLLAVAVAGCASRVPTQRPTSAETARVSPVTQTVGDSLDAILARALADSAFPGAVAVVGLSDTVIVRAVGRLDAEDPAAPTIDETLWDLASLTKVVATTSALMQLVSSGSVALDEPVRRYLPEWTAPGSEAVTVRHLLTHSGGLPAWRPLHKEAPDSPAAALALALSTPLDTVAGVRYVYSDVGAIVLGKLVERVSGMPLDVYLAQRLWAPLGMSRTSFKPAVSQRAFAAPTEYDPWRQRKMRGEVHDENAYALGGVSGHAGLFSTGDDLARFARALLDGRLPGVSAATFREFTRRQDSTLSHRALGWETATGSNSAGSRMSARAFGHTGFTGTSLWVDPSHGVFVVLLTNRVNPTRENRRIGAVRVRLADAVLGTLQVAGQDAAANSSPLTPAP